MVVADSDILADRFWVRVADFFGQQTAMPFSDNGPFVANLIGTLAGGDALIGLRSRGDTNHPFILVNQMQSEAEAKFRQTEQALQKHLDDTEKQLRTLRQGPGGGDQASAQAVITPEQRAAIDAARKDIVDTRQQLRAVQFDLNRDISRLETELRVFNIVLVPALLAIAGDRPRRRAPPPPREGTAHETAHPARRSSSSAFSPSPAAGISAPREQPGEQQAYDGRQADVPRPRAEAAGRRAHRDHPPGQDDGDRRSTATPGAWPIAAATRCRPASCAAC